MRYLSNLRAPSLGHDPVERLVALAMRHVGNLLSGETQSRPRGRSRDARSVRQRPVVETRRRNRAGCRARRRQAAARRAHRGSPRASLSPGWESPKTPGTRVAPCCIEVKGELLALLAPRAAGRSDGPPRARARSAAPDRSLHRSRQRPRRRHACGKRNRGEEVPRHAPRRRRASRPAKRRRPRQGFLPHGLLTRGDHQEGDAPKK